MMKRALSAGWNKWRIVVCSLRADLTSLKRGVMRFIMFKLAAAWLTWRAAAAHSARCYKLTWSSILRMVLHDVAAAFNTWRDIACAAVEKRCLAERVLKRMNNRALSKTW